MARSKLGIKRLNAFIHGRLLELGWDVRRAVASDPSIRWLPPDAQISDLELALHVLLYGRENLSIVHIGANDGRVADPLHDFVMSHASQTRILLIEPQPYLLPYLRESYCGHPDARITNQAVGVEGPLTLFAIDRRFWSDFAAPRDWPIYRAPTGITSSSRDHVEAWAATHYRGRESVRDLVVELTTRSLPLDDILEKTGFGAAVDALVVDVEGADDAVLYECSIGRLKPVIISFEHKHLPSPRMERLLEFLAGHDYVVRIGVHDTLAVRRAT